METIYNVDYFIKKFEAIPERLFTIFKRHNGEKHCAHGWCDPARTSRFNTPEEIAFSELASQISLNGRPLQGFATINNGMNPNYNQRTPKQRILAALYDIKAKQQPEVKERIVYVTVDAPVRELQKEILSPQ